jgi:hypothetical protein
MTCMELEAFELVMLRRPAQATEYPEAELDRIQGEHLAYHAELRAGGDAGLGRLSGLAG